MHKLLIRTLLLITFLVSACSERGQVHIEHAWIAEVDEGASVTAYLEVVNPGSEAVDIVSAASEAFETVSFFIRENGQLKEVESLTVPARGELILDGQGGQLALNNRQRAIKDGDHLPLSLAARLQNGQLITLESELHVHLGEADEKHEHDHDHDHH